MTRLKSAAYIILAVYVDDLVIAGTTQKAISIFKQQITAKYDCEDLGALDRILNMEVVRTKEEGLFLSQSLYIKVVLGRFKTHLPVPGTKLKGAETPMDHRVRLPKNGATHMRFKPKEKDIKKRHGKVWY